MTTEILKSRAKRLRPAIVEMFGVPVSTAQALELVAKEENFPNWDAASACFKPTTNTKQAITLIRLSANGAAAYLGAEFMKSLKRTDPGKIIFVGTPDEATNQAIDDFRQSGGIVDVLKSLSHSEEEQISLSNYVTAFMPPPMNI